MPTTKGTWTAPVNTVDKSHGTYSLQLKSAGMTTANGYDVVHGPSVYSDIFAGENGHSHQQKYQSKQTVHAPHHNHSQLSCPHSLVAENRFHGTYQRYLPALSKYLL